MKRNQSSLIQINPFKIGFLGMLIIMISLAGCDLSDAGDREQELIPREPGDPIVIVEDFRSDEENGNWMAQYIVGGSWADTWFINQYERPFSAYEMVYQAHLDIVEARIRPAGDWTVFEIQALAPPAGQWIYVSLEIDTDLDNRPDFLFLTRALEDTTWNDQMVTVLVDLNKNAGGNRPRLAEPYEEIWDGFVDRYDDEMTSAFVRLSPESDSTYQIAVLNELLEGDQFIWRVWLEGNIYHPEWVEYNDRISLEEAGSPYLYSPNYPLKNLASMDNTCLHFFGGETNQPQPGFCNTIIELAGEETLPPDDQFTNQTADNPVTIVFPSSDPGDGDNDPDPTLIVFDPGYFFQPTPTPYPILQEFPTMEFDVPETPEILVVEVVTPEILTSVAETLVAESYPAPTAESMGFVEETAMFDPYAGSTPPPTEMFDPYQGSSPTPTPKPDIHFITYTPTRPVIIMRTATPTDKPVIIIITATPTP